MYRKITADRHLDLKNNFYPSELEDTTQNDFN